MKQQSGLQPTRIGLGTPGVLDPIIANHEKLQQHSPERTAPEKRPGRQTGYPLRTGQRRQLFCFAETHWGVVKEKAPDAKMVFGIIMGTGVGGGIVINGHVWNGKHGIGGEWGHNFLDESGGPCYCGRTGCVETVLSGPGLQRYYKSITGSMLSLKDILAHAVQGNDQAAVKTIERLNHFFGKAVSVITNMLDPDVIVVGGGVGNIDSIYTGGC